MQSNTKIVKRNSTSSSNTKRKSVDTSDNVKVCARIRPFNKLENKKAGDSCCIKTQENNKSFIKHYFTGYSAASNEEGKHEFNFDRVFISTSTQKEVYEFMGAPVVNDVLRGFNGTIFA